MTDETEEFIDSLTSEDIEILKALIQAMREERKRQEEFLERIGPDGMALLSKILGGKKS